MIRISLYCLLLMIVLTGCSTLKTSSDYQAKTDFTRLKTYAWLDNKKAPSDSVRLSDPLVVETIQRAVDKELGDKGFTLVKREKADFLVSWFGTIEQKLKVENINNFYRPYGYGALYRDPAWNPQGQVKNVIEYEEGTLVFDIIDPTNQKLIWSGTGRDKILQDPSEATVKRNINSAVKSILANFPPK